VDLRPRSDKAQNQKTPGPQGSIKHFVSFEGTARFRVFSSGCQRAFNPRILPVQIKIRLQNQLLKLTRWLLLPWMKKRRLLILASLFLVALAGILWKTRTTPPPVLAFKWYGRSATSGNQTATFELRNTTRSSIWILYSGGWLSGGPGFVKRPVVVAPPMAKNAAGIYSLSAGSFFMRGKIIFPGDSLILEFPLDSATPAQQVGIRYYTGHFKTENDFLDSLFITMPPPLPNDASLNQRIGFYWDKAKNSFPSFKSQHEVWCPQPVSFQTNN
jgi:hypothetical protein